MAQDLIIAGWLHSLSSLFRIETEPKTGRALNGDYQALSGLLEFTIASFIAFLDAVCFFYTKLSWSIILYSSSARCVWGTWRASIVVSENWSLENKMVHEYVVQI
jgi:hypothetical protein